MVKKLKTIAQADALAHVDENVICGWFVSETEKAFCVKVEASYKSGFFQKNIWLPKSALRPVTENDLNPKCEYYGDFQAVCAEWLARAKGQEGVVFGGSYKVDL